MRLLESAIPLVLLLALLLVLAVTGNLFSRSPLAIAAQVLAVVVNVWARVSFPAGAFRVGAEPAGGVTIRRGPYRFIRHPMYASALLFLWAGVLTHLKAWTLLLAVADTALVIGRIVSEERLLRQAYPDYDQYVRTTKALVPFVA